MGLIKQHRPVYLLAAITSRYDEAFNWCQNKLIEAWGPLDLSSERFCFSETSYYEKSMGSELKKQFWVFDQLVDPASLPEFKILSNQLEESYAETTDWPVERPINIDPGYLTEAKLVLATTKDRDHRIYLSQGIYAEVTLFFNRGQWKERPWTYPDYQREDFQDFFTRCRNELRNRYRKLDQAVMDERDYHGGSSS